ncbi:MAG TPA: phosphate/phosphite/phosphonate ABC transporter substrate-binding protein [Candidatus Limnocylindria bacterium]|jgi:phosphonate transport system substrate-binding protein|nr:phosphate/phosphite/phosphonate ABC transporter substrate-binding protein [Candidatus Limnocylindria bacterium]
MKPFRISIALLAIAMLVAACSGTGSPSTSATTAASQSTAASASADEKADWPDQIVIGFVPSREADALVEKIQPLADVLAKDLGIKVEGKVSNDYTGLVEAMGSGQADVGAFGPTALLQSVDRAGAEIILQSVRNGGATYHTQWMTNNPSKYCSDTPKENDRNVGDGKTATYLNCNGTAHGATERIDGPKGQDALAKVKGAKVSFVEQTSSSGYVFPALQLVQAGLDYQKDIDPIFAGGHDASVIAVCNGDAEVGVSFDDARGIAKTDCDLKNKAVVFAYSPEIPNDGWSVRGDLPQSLKDAITQSLINYAKSDAGKKVLHDIYEIDDLVPAKPGAYDIVKEANDKIQAGG